MSESLSTVFAHIGTFIAMYPLVVSEICRLGETFLAIAAVELLLSCMILYVGD